MAITNRKPMSADEARQNVTLMRDETAKAARIMLLKLALGPVGNLTDEARKVYEDALKADAALVTQ